MLASRIEPATNPRQRTRARIHTRVQTKNYIYKHKATSYTLLNFVSRIALLRTNFLPLFPKNANLFDNVSIPV